MDFGGVFSLRRREFCKPMYVMDIGYFKNCLHGEIFVWELECLYRKVSFLENDAP